MDVINDVSHRIHVWYIYTNIGGILMVNVTIYGIHGSYGYVPTKNIKPTNIKQKGDSWDDGKCIFHTWSIWAGQPVDLPLW